MFGMDMLSGIMFQDVYQMRSRYYSAPLARFWSPHPAGVAAQSLNMYVYADNQPTQLIDPRGTFYLPVPATRPATGQNQNRETVPSL